MLEVFREGSNPGRWQWLEKASWKKTKCSWASKCPRISSEEAGEWEFQEKGKFGKQ